MTRLSPARRAAIQRIIFPVLVLLSVIMIILGKVDQVMFEPLRISLTDATVPILDALSRPVVAAGNVVDDAVKLVHLHQENVRLEKENLQLLHWQQAALTLASENAQLRGLLKLAPESAVSYVSARVIADSGGAYVRNLMVDAGSDIGIARGQAAITGAGLVGRVEEVGTRAARILLITDLNSRVPVIVERSRQRAILAGDNSERRPVLSVPRSGGRAEDWRPRRYFGRRRCVSAGSSGRHRCRSRRRGPPGRASCRIVAGRISAHCRLRAGRRTTHADHDCPARPAAGDGCGRQGEPSLTAGRCSRSPTQPRSHRPKMSWSAFFRLRPRLRRRCCRSSRCICRDMPLWLPPSP